MLGWMCGLAAVKKAPESVTLGLMVLQLGNLIMLVPFRLLLFENFQESDTVSDVIKNAEYCSNLYDLPWVFHAQRQMRQRVHRETLSGVESLLK